MGLTIIVKSKLKSHGRSDYHRVLKDEGWGGAGMTEEQADKCEFLERQAKKEGVDRPTSFRQHQIDQWTSGKPKEGE
jgi:hypothetical protein